MQHRVIRVRGCRVGFPGFAKGGAGQRLLARALIPVVAGAAALLVGVSGAAARGGDGGHGRGDPSSTALTVIHPLVHGDDRKSGDDHGGKGDRDKHEGSGSGASVPPPVQTPTPAPQGGHAGVRAAAVPATPLPVSIPSLGLPDAGQSPAASGPQGSITHTGQSGTAPPPAPIHTLPRAVPVVPPLVVLPFSPPQPVPPQAPATPPATPKPTSLPLVLIPPSNLPAPPQLHSVAGSLGLGPLVGLLFAMLLLCTILGIRVARRAR